MARGKGAAKGRRFAPALMSELMILCGKYCFLPERRVYGCPTLRVRGSGLCARFTRIGNVRIPTLKDEGSGTRKTNATPPRSVRRFLGGRSFSSDIPPPPSNGLQPLRNRFRLAGWILSRYRGSIAATFRFGTNPTGI